MRKVISNYILGLALIFPFSGVTQSNQEEPNNPEVGKRCPDFFLSEVVHFEKQSVCLDDFKGKWLILDCWNKWCISCIKSMPKMDSLQKEYSKSVQFFLVGYTGSQYSGKPDNDGIRTLYEGIMQRTGLQLPIAYDSILFRRFDIGACPFIIIVNPEGILSGLTYEINKAEINELLAGRKPNLTRITTLGEQLEQDYIRENKKRKSEVNGVKNQ